MVRLSPASFDVTWAAARLTENQTGILQVGETSVNQPEKIIVSCCLLFPSLAGLRVGPLSADRPTGMLRYPARFCG